MEVQLCREFGWTKQEMESQDDDFIWDCTTILSHEGAKMKRDMPSSRPTRRPL